jgi:hypothetical protein
MGEIFAATEEPNKCTTLLRGWIANRPAQSRVGRFQSIEYGALSHRIVDLKLHLVIDPRQRAKVGWKHDSYHASV